MGSPTSHVDQGHPRWTLQSAMQGNQRSNLTGPVAKIVRGGGPLPFTPSGGAADAPIPLGRDHGSTLARRSRDRRRTFAGTTL